MIRRCLGALALMLATLAVSSASAEPPRRGAWTLVIHGGAGVIERGRMSPQQETSYRAALNAALDRGSAVLSRGGSSLDAIEAVITGLEDDPQFNAGRGAVFTAAGRNELDAAIMDGATMNAGSVAGVTTVRHPISLARAVMTRSPHVMMVGQGAEQFAREQGLEIVPPSFFFTERRWNDLIRTLNERHEPIPSRPEGVPPAPAPAPTALIEDPTHRFGTVGVVAVDQAGNVAAGTSTGGTSGKRWGRVGDTPIIGAGTYASNQSCAVSATGTGEFFIRLTVAREICALVQYRGMSLQAAADEVIQRRLTAIHGDGGVIAVAPDGQAAWSFNTPGMYRARASSAGDRRVAIYADEG